MPRSLPFSPLLFGAALLREWVADHVQLECAVEKPSALLLDGADPHVLPGLFLAAIRLGLPTVVADPHDSPFAVALTAAGFAPLSGEWDSLASPRVAVGMVESGGPLPGELLNSFSLANALRAGLAAGGGPEFLVHLAAVAREAGEMGFSRMIRVIVPESPALAGSFTSADLLALLADALHDVWTVEGKRLFETLPELPEERPAERHRLRFVAGRSSGAEAIVGVSPGVEEIAGECRVYSSEDKAIEAVDGGRVGEGNLLVVAGCGVRGGPGLLRLDFLGEGLRAAGLDVPVITDGLPPDKPSGALPWISLFEPEAAAGGVIGRLRDGDALRIDLVEGRIRTGVQAEEMERRVPYDFPGPAGAGYAARYARSALPALEGAGYG